MKKCNSILLIISICLFQWGCQSLKKEEVPLAAGSSPQQAQWETKTMISDKVSGKSHILNLDVLARKNEIMRLEVSTTLGLSLASILIEKGNIKYILPRQKRYFSGPLNSEALKPVLNVALDPRLLNAAFFEESYPDWSCQADHGLIVKCQLPEGVSVAWDRQNSGAKKVIIMAPQFELQMQTTKFQEKKELPKSIGTLSIPSSFKQLLLN